MPFTARRAVILAAGRGARLSPLTDTIPKPLLSFAGKPIIETIIARVHRAGIREIAVVTGYKADMFAYLPGAFPGLVLRHNERWADGNNVLSAAAAIDLMADALVINGDAIITADVLDREYAGTTMYADRSVGPSREWELVLGADGLVAAVNTQGGKDILQHREVTFVCADDFPAFKERVMACARQSETTSFFEFCLLPQARVHVKQVPYQAIFDIDDYADWVSHPLAGKK